MMVIYVLKRGNFLKSFYLTSFKSITYFYNVNHFNHVNVNYVTNINVNYVTNVNYFTNVNVNYVANVSVNLLIMLKSIL